MFLGLYVSLLHFHACRMVKRNGKLTSWAAARILRAVSSPVCSLVCNTLITKPPLMNLLGWITSALTASCLVSLVISTTAVVNCSRRSTTWRTSTSTIMSLLVSSLAALSFKRLERSKHVLVLLLKLCKSIQAHRCIVVVIERTIKILWGWCHKCERLSDPFLVFLMLFFFLCLFCFFSSV